VESKRGRICAYENEGVENDKETVDYPDCGHAGYGHLMPKPVSATEFGVDYYPYINGVFTNQFLFDDNWNDPDTQNLIKADLNMMNSMGLTCQRMIFFPHGWITPTAYDDPNYVAPSFNSDWDEMLDNLPDYLGLLEERGIKLVIASPSPLLKTKSQRPGYTNLYLWQYFYGPTGWNNFMADTQKYITDIVNAVATSGHPTTVKWFDISNEISTTAGYLNYPQYLRAIYDGGWVTPSKIGFSALRVINGGENDFTTLRTTAWLSPSRATLTKLTDTHSYPEKNPKAITELAYRYNWGQAQYPNSTTIVGEYGYSFDSPSSEATQRDKEIEIMDKCIEAGVPYAMHWLWAGIYRPNGPDPDAVIADWFRNHDINQPNDIVGSVGTKLSLFTNGDMESWPPSGPPTGWTYSSSGAQPTASRFGGATNSYCYRLTPNQPGGHNIWTVSPRVTVPACSNNCPSQGNIYVNAYIRSNKMSNVRVTVHQYDAGGNEIGSPGTTSPPLPSGTSNLQWYSFQHQIPGGWTCSAAQNMRSIRVNVIGHVDDPTAILDTDTVTASVR